jgi:hypothetical protein
VARWEEAANLVRQGHSPASVARQMGVSINTVLPYLFLAIGSGQLTRTQAMFTIPKEVRAAVDESISQLGSGANEQQVVKATRCRDWSDDIRAYLRLKGNFDAWLVALVDLYRSIAFLEVMLHAFVRESLRFLYGRNWWTGGVPESVRKDCRNSQESDPEQIEDPFLYTNFIHLKQILDRNWGDFQKVVPSAVAHDKNGLLSRLVRLNHVRNRVMHPIKQQLPTEDDFAFVVECMNFLNLYEWRVFRPE